MTKPFASLHETDLFSAAATKGWAWYKHNAELVEHTAALRSLKLLVGSGCLEFQNRMAGMDPETNMSSHGANICSWNAHSPVSNPRRLKALSAVVTEEDNQYIVTLLGHHNSVTKPSASLHETGFLQLQRIWEWCKNVELVERAVALRGSGCLELMARMDSLDKHVVTCCEHLQPEDSQTRFQPTEAKSWISTILHWLAAVAYIYAYIRQPRSQSISCRPNFGYLDSIFCKHDATIMLNKSRFGSASHFANFANMGSWNAGGNTSKPRRLRSQSR